MADVDMKQKIKEVRDKFLSNNQIEDIRQNITLGVEERLKFLNTEQIKVVELLEEKHRELDNELRNHAEKLDEDKKTIEASLNETTSSLEAMVVEQSIKLENQSNSSGKKMSELEATLKKEFKTALNNQEMLLKSNLSSLSDEMIKNASSLSDKMVKNASSLSDEMVKIETDISRNETKISEKLVKNVSQLETLSQNTINEVNAFKETLEKKFEETKEETLKTIHEKLSIYETDKKLFLKDASDTFTNTLSKLESKIESFIENHEMVEDIIDSRLTEFRNAQKAAFEELEAALTLLERHQDDTINRFKNKSELGINKHINIQTSSPKNRGSILHQPKETIEELVPTIHSTVSENENIHAKNLVAYRTKLIFLLVLTSVLVTVVITYFNVDYNSFLTLAKNLLQ